MKEMIKKGDIPKASAKCPICGCEFLYDRRDVCCDSMTFYNGCSRSYYVNCLCCEGELTISKENIEKLKLNS